jgi:hypothetical protein
MKQDEIIKLANDAELCQTIWIDDSDDEMVQSVIRFAKLIAKKQAEECEFLCEELWRKGGWEHNAGFAATCIRKRFLNDDSQI